VSSVNRSRGEARSPVVIPPQGDTATNSLPLTTAV